MSLLVAHCPRCGANKITFDVLAQVPVGVEFGWKLWFELFCLCRSCHVPTDFLVSLDRDFARLSDRFETTDALVKWPTALNNHFKIERFISLRDHAKQAPPDFVEGEVARAFEEGAACLSIACYNAAATMFRLCVDIVTRQYLPPNSSDEANPKPNEKQRRDLGLRLRWLFENRLIPLELEDLAKCIREDANDGAHVGNLSKEEAEDILDFTFELLERLVTEPKRLEQAAARREPRRKGGQ